MKYLVLLLFVLVSSVNADTYGELSYIDKKMLNVCRLENFPDNTSYEEKGDYCVIAGTLLNELLQKEYNETKKARLVLETTQMWVKAGNFYYLGNINNEVTNEISEFIYYSYNTICLNNSKKETYQVSVCENLLMYKGFDETKVRTSQSQSTY